MKQKSVLKKLVTVPLNKENSWCIPPKNFLYTCQNDKSKLILVLVTFIPATVDFDKTNGLVEVICVKIEYVTFGEKTIQIEDGRSN